MACPRGAGRADGDPALVLLGLIRVLDQFEAELSDLESERLVIFADYEGDVGKVGHGSRYSIC